MSVLIIPAIEKKPWPTMGDQVADWIERHLVFGPGDLRGQPAKLDDEKRALLQRMYEVYPKEHPQAGRRRYRRAALSLRKGSAKSEFAAWIAAAELHPRAPVRFNGWDRRGRPLIGVGVIDPYLPLVAYTEEQSEDLVYGALRVVLEYSSVRGDFDIGIERIMRVGGDGKAVALAAAPDARDGARTTFQVFDETHRFTLPRLKQAHRTMLANLPKRRIADPWSLEITTAPAPGENSVAEDTMEFAKAISEGRASDSRFFFFHRQAKDGAHDLDTEEGLRNAVLEASGPLFGWSDIEGIIDQWKDPTADRSYLERVWLNRPVRAADRAFDAERWRELHREGYRIAKGAHVVLGFDGSRREDSTGIVATEIETGFQEVAGHWEKPFGAQGEDWEVPQLEVEAAMETAFKRWQVWRLYADPPYWETTVGTWSGQFGKERVAVFSTRLWGKIAAAIRAYSNAQINGELSHDGNPAFARHIANSFRRVLLMRDEEGRPLWVIQKERADSPNKIDLAMCGVLSWQARLDARQAGVGRRKRSGYEARVPTIAGLPAEPPRQPEAPA